MNSVLRSLHADRQADFSVASTTTRLWTSEERDRVPQWFRERKHLPQEEVEAQFEQDFGYHRSFGAIQTASYHRPKQKGHGNSRKRRRTLGPDNPSQQPNTTEPASGTEPSNVAPRSLTSDSVPRASISFLDALKRFPRPEIPMAESDQPKDSSAELLQTAHAEAQMPSNATDGISRYGHSFSSTSLSEIRNPGQAVTGIPYPTVGETLSVSMENGRQFTQLDSTSERDGNGPGHTNTETTETTESYELGAHASFQPINLGPRPGSGAVRAHASMTAIPAMNSDKLDTRKIDGGPAGHAATADSDGHILLGINRGNSVPGPQIPTGDQRDGGVAWSHLANEPREDVSPSQSQHERQYLSTSVPETESRTVADAVGPFRPQSSNTSRSQNLSQMSSHISATQQIDYTGVQFADAQRLESPSHEHHHYHTGTATPAGPTPSETPDATIQGTSKEKFTRSRTGCTACRKKRVKCDENSPTCNNCARSGLPCDGPRKPGRKPSAQQRIVVLKYAHQAGMRPEGVASSVSDGNQVNVAESTDSSGAKACVSDRTKETSQQRSISEASIGSTPVSNGCCPITPFSTFVWDQETLPGSLVSPPTYELPSIANLAAGRYEIPSIRQMFDLSSTSPH